MLQSGQHPAADTEKATVVYQLASNGNHTNGDIGKVRLVNTHTHLNYLIACGVLNNFQQTTLEAFLARILKS